MSDTWPVWQSTVPLHLVQGLQPIAQDQPPMVLQIDHAVRFGLLVNPIAQVVEVRWAA